MAANLCTSVIKSGINNHGIDTPIFKSSGFFLPTLTPISKVFQDTYMTACPHGWHWDTGCYHYAKS